MRSARSGRVFGKTSASPSSASTLCGRRETAGHEQTARTRRPAPMDVLRIVRVSSPPTNRWCERLGLAPTPRPEDLVGRRDVAIFHLMIVAEAVLVDWRLLDIHAIRFATSG